MTSWDDDNDQLAADLRAADLELEGRERAELGQLMATNPEAPKLRGTRIWFEREGGFLRITMRIAYPADAPLPANGVGQGAWHSIAAFCAGWLQAAGLRGRRSGRA